MKKIFVLDTSVLLFNEKALFSFKEHDIVIPMIVLQELDKYKVGYESKHFKAREVIRKLEELCKDNNLNKWNSLGKNYGKFKVMKPSNVLPKNAEIIFSEVSNDNKILNTCITVKKLNTGCNVILVSKDINLRLKARVLGLEAEDYLDGQVEIPSNKGDESFYSEMKVSSENITELYSLKVIDNLKKVSKTNYGIIQDELENSALYKYFNGKYHLVEKKWVCNIKPKNLEQTFAIDALMDSDKSLVVLEGYPGTGKTLLALAASLEQKNEFERIIVSRPTISLNNREIGFLPGNVEDKISHFMLPLFDNLKYIKSTYAPDSKKRKQIEKLEEDGFIEITALNFIRGRSLNNCIFIIDEAQNLTPHEVKTIITRAGVGTKIIFTGDIHQIDTPYLDEFSNGLSYIISKFKNEDIFSYIKLTRGERSELANLANKLL